ncbi:MAG: hypothetical protein H7A37_05330 [Chlamydiales bacterium]|nr:hypothetical protein [Chlamydiia bacterium]MCP5507701.1 hypothetical protein [Chlamydiales bacterium]
MNPLDHSFYRLFLVTNEQGQGLTLEKLGDPEKTPAEGSVMIGTAAFFNLNAIAARHSPIKKLIIIDKSPVAKYFWEKFSEIMDEVNQPKLWHLRALAHHRPVLQYQREIVIEKVEKLLKDKRLIWANFWGEPSALRPFQLEFYDGVSWLFDDQRFEKICRLFKEKRFEFHQASFTEPNSIAEVIHSIPREMTVDMLYLSNIREYATKEEEHDKFVASLYILKTVCTNNTYVIDTLPREGGISSPLDLRQRITKNFLIMLSDFALLSQTQPGYGY